MEAQKNPLELTLPPAAAVQPKDGFMFDNRFEVISLSKKQTMDCVLMLCFTFNYVKALDT